MFENIKTSGNVNLNPNATKVVEIPRTVQFLQAVIGEGFRLTYASLARAARVLGEDSSNQLPGQRGAALLKGLPKNLQPYICRANGGYARGISWDCETPKDLRSRPFLTPEVVEEAVEAWEAASQG